jgi:ParB-like chromosome segregation protein Spo0J
MVQQKLEQLHMSGETPTTQADEAGIKELAQSMRRWVKPRQSLSVTREQDRGYDIAAGTRRYVAAKVAGLSTSPA